jgi:hypothetical protein
MKIENKTKKKIPMKIVFITIFILVCLTSYLAQTSATSASIKQITDRSASVELQTIYGREEKNSVRYLLKLYSNYTYEYLKFYISQFSPALEREAGTYTQKGNRITLLTEEAIGSLAYPKKYKVDENKRMLKTRGIHLKRCDHHHLHKLRNEVYWKDRYIDAQYGTISNSILSQNNVITPKTQLIPGETFVANEAQSNPLEEQAVKEILYEYNPVNLNKQPISQDSLSSLKAVLIAIENGEKTNELLEEMKQIGIYLENKGVNVVKIFSPDDTWKKIVEECRDANLVIYSGHGGPNGEIAANKKSVDEMRVRMDFKMKKNGLIIFNQVSFASGSNNEKNENDYYSSEIENVRLFSNTYLNAGAGGFYSTNLSNQIIPFLTNFFNHNSLKNCYTKNVQDSKSKSEYEEPFPDFPRYEYGLSIKESNILIENTFNGRNSKYLQRTRSFPHAFAGRKDYSFKNLFK